MICRALIPGSSTVYEYICFYSDADIASNPSLDAADKYINDATVFITVVNRAGTAVLDALELQYVAASDGLYRAIDSPNELITLNAKYTWVLTATLPSGAVKRSSANIWAENDAAQDPLEL